MQWIKRVYLYLVSLVALIILVVASISLINLGLKTWVFTKADQDFYGSKIVCPTRMPEGLEADCEEEEYTEEELQRQRDQRTARKQRDAAQAIAMIVVAAPVFVFHFRLARKEK